MTATEIRGTAPHHLASSRAIAHTYATSPGLAWSACFSFSLFGRQRLRWETRAPCKSRRCSVGFRRCSAGVRYSAGRRRTVPRVSGRQAYRCRLWESLYSHIPATQLIMIHGSHLQYITEKGSHHVTEKEKKWVMMWIMKLHHISVRNINHPSSATFHFVILSL